MSNSKPPRIGQQCRRRYFVDPPLQGAMLRQAFYYWLAASVTFAFIVVIYRISPAMFSDAAHESSRLWYHLAPFAVASAVLLPIVMFSAIRFSHRFAGPMVRVRRALFYLANGETPQHLVLRQGDFWADVAEDINRITKRMRPVLDEPLASEADHAAPDEAADEREVAASAR